MKTASAYAAMQPDRGQPDNLSEAYSDFVANLEDEGVADPAEVDRLWGEHCRRFARAARMRFAPGRFADVDPGDLDPDTGAPYPGYSSPSLDDSFHAGEMNVD